MTDDPRDKMRKINIGYRTGEPIYAVRLDDPALVALIAERERIAARFDREAEWREKTEGYQYKADSIFFRSWAEQIRSGDHEDDLL